MTRVLFYFPILVLCNIFHGSNGVFERFIKSTHQPYGPNMCKEFCDSSSYFLLYLAKDLSCQRITILGWNNTEKYNTETLSVCVRQNMTLKGSHFISAMSEFDICYHEYYEGIVSTFQTKPATEEDCSKELQLLQDKNNHILLWACQEGHLDVVKHLISLGVADINCRNELGRTPVMVATEMGQLAVYRFLVSHGSDMSIVDNNKDNVLHVACKNGHVEIVRDLVENVNYDINTRGWRKTTPVMTAAMEGHKSVVDFLIRKGCNLTAVDGDGNNILHAMCLKGDLEMVKLIFNFGIVDLNTKGFQRQTPLMMAASKGHKGIVKYLVHKGYNLKDKHGNNILHVACIEGNIDLVKSVLSLGIIGVNSKGKLKQTPAMMAAENGHNRVVKYLFSKDCNLKAIDKYGNNILHIACIRGNVDLVKYILSLDVVNINSKGKFKQTPAMMAAKNGHNRIVKYLFRKGCNLKAVDKFGNNILHVVCMRGNVDLVKYILSLDVVNINSRAQFHKTPLMKAARYGHLTVVKIFVTKGCKMKALDKKGNNILHLACIEGDLDMVKLILSYGVIDTAAINKWGNNILHLACKEGHLKLFKFLVTKGFNLKKIDRHGNNILHHACKHGHLEMVKYLLTLKGIKKMKKMKNNNNETPEKIAKLNGKKSIARLLR